MQEPCIHGLESGCTFCSGKETTLSPLPKQRGPAKKKQPVDANAERAAKVAAGEICGLCHLATDGAGCWCVRQEEYDIRQSTQRAFGFEARSRLADERPNRSDPHRTLRSVLRGSTFAASVRAGVSPEDGRVDRRELIGLVLGVEWR